MFTLSGGVSITTPVIDIVLGLRQQLIENNINLLRDVRDVDKDKVVITCPFHKNGQESSPSSNVFINDGRCLFHCFACGETHEITTFISLVMGIENDGGVYGRQWLLDHFTSLGDSRQKLFTFVDNVSEKQSMMLDICREDLSKYRFIHPYMYQRKLTDEIIEKFDIGYDANYKFGYKTMPCLTFPVYNENGELKFVARRSICGKIYRYPSGVEKPVYGLHEIRTYKPKEKTVYICESFINALTLWTWGYTAVALMGTGTPNQYNILNRQDFRRFIFCLDGDDAGDRGTIKLYNNISNRFIKNCVKMPRGKDINDLKKEQFDLLSIY